MPGLTRGEDGCSLSSSNKNVRVLPVNRAVSFPALGGPADDLVAEIQVRTVLQHAWAEIDREGNEALSLDRGPSRPHTFNVHSVNVNVRLEKLHG
jgi:hypothetical protein